MRSHPDSANAVPLFLVASAITLITIGLLTVFHVIDFQTGNFGLSSFSTPSPGDFEMGTNLFNSAAGVIMSVAGIASLLEIRKGRRMGR